MTVERAPLLSDRSERREGPPFDGAGGPNGWGDPGSGSHSGLRHGVLSPLETLAQSVSTIAPTTSPTLTIPLVFAMAGNATWLAYLCAMACVLAVALCLGYYARASASCGSLYSYAQAAGNAAGGRAWLSAAAGPALVLAYAATGASVVGGFINYGGVLADSLRLPHAPGILLAALAVSAAVGTAYRDVTVSARLMLWIEAVSVLSIAIVLGLLLRRQGLHLHLPQAQLRGAHVPGLRLGVVLALFSFVGFESATALGSEARSPLKTIPRAVLGSALLAGVFFLVCTYVEVLGFDLVHHDLGESTAPLHILAGLAGVPALAPVIDLGAFVSMFACALACVTAAARVMLRMAEDGRLPVFLARTHKRHRTPATAALLAGAATFVPVAVLNARGVSGADIYGYMGSLAVYGFITVYGITAAGLPAFLRVHGTLTRRAQVLAAAATLAMVAALAGTLYPMPAPPYNWLPYVYLGYLTVGLGLQARTSRLPRSA